MTALESSYTRIRELGRGGMGVVHLARQHALDRLVAIKELLLHPGEEQMLARRFEREAQTLAKLAHPNVVRLLDFDLAHDPPYLVCEYVEGGTSVAQLLALDPPELVPALRLAAGVVDGLAYIHAAGVVHRDLKPANVLIDGEGRPRIIDFGLARPAAGDQTNLTVDGQLIGTYSYMAPEQMAGHPADVRSDVYAFGLLLYELAAGEPVFSSTALDPVSPDARMAGQIPPLQQRAAGVDAGVLEVVDRCLQVDPAGRWADGGELARALLGALKAAGDVSGSRIILPSTLAPEPLPVPAPSRSGTPTARLPRTTSRFKPVPAARRGAHPLAIALAAVAAGLCGVALGLSFWSAPRRGMVHVEPVSPAPSAPAHPQAQDDAELLTTARDAAGLDPRTIRAGGDQRLPAKKDLLALRARTLHRYAGFLERASSVLDSPSAPIEARRTVYRGVSRLRLLDRMLLVNGLPPIDADRALGRTFRAGLPAGVTLEPNDLGLAPASARVQQIGLQLPSAMRDLLEAASDGQDTVHIDLSTPPGELRWASIRVRTVSLGRRDVLWVTLNGLPLMLDDRCVAERGTDGWFYCHFVPPALLRAARNEVQVAHEVLPGAGTASILRQSSVIAISGSTRELSGSSPAR